MLPLRNLAITRAGSSPVASVWLLLSARNAAHFVTQNYVLRSCTHCACAAQTARMRKLTRRFVYRKLKLFGRESGIPGLARNTRWPRERRSNRIENPQFTQMSIGSMLVNETQVWGTHSTGNTTSQNLFAVARRVPLMGRFQGTLSKSGILKRTVCRSAFAAYGKPELQLFSTNATLTGSTSHRSSPYNTNGTEKSNSLRIERTSIFQRQIVSLKLKDCGDQNTLQNTRH